MLVLLVCTRVPQGGRRLGHGARLACGGPGVQVTAELCQGQVLERIEGGMMRMNAICVTI